MQQSSQTPAHATQEAPLGVGAAEHLVEAIFVFRLNGTLLGIPAQFVDGVIDNQRTSPIPFASPHLLGIVNHRGLEALAVVDLATFLGLQPVEDAENNRMVVVEQASMRVAFPCERALGVAKAAGAVTSNTEALQGSQLRSFLHSEVKLRYGYVGVLNVEALIDAARVR